MLFPGSRSVWLSAAAVFAVILGLLAWQLTERKYPAYTSTDSVGVRSLVVDVAPGRPVCIPALRVTRDSRFIRLQGFSAGPRPELRWSLRRADGVTRGMMTAGAAGWQVIDMPIAGEPTARDSAPATLCVASDGVLSLGGTGGGIYAGDPGTAITVEGKRQVGTYVAVWFLPDRSSRTSLLDLLPTLTERASLFRPGFVGPWLYYLLLFGLVPAMAYSGVRLLAKTAAGSPTRVPLALAIALITFANCLTWALITPPFLTPDEQEHFGYAQYLAETGNAPSRSANHKPAWSNEETVALDSIRLPSRSAIIDARPPWFKADEERWRERVRRLDPGRKEGGGATAATTHSPLYYGMLAPAYWAASGGSIWSRLTAMRAVSGLLAALTAVFAYLLVLELVPGRRVLAAAAGLLIAFQPMFTFMGGAVNNDMAVNAASAALAFLLIRGLRRGPTVGVAAGIGALIILAPLAKATALALFPAVAVGIAGMLWRYHGRSTWRAYAAMAGAAAALGIAWVLLAPVFDRDVFTTPGGTAPGTGTGVGSAALDMPKTFLSYLWQEFLPKLPFMHDLHPQKWPAYDIYVQRGWAAFGWYTVQFSNWVYKVIVVVMLLTAAAAIVSAIRRTSTTRSLSVEIAVLFLMVTGVIVGVAAAYFTPVGGREGVFEQGRYAFTAIAPLAALAVAGCTVLGARRIPVLTGLLVAATAGLFAASGWLALSQFYA